MGDASTSNPLRVVVIGAGIGGLVCAIAAAREGLSVQVLERAPEILPVGAGIQIPPNAARILIALGLEPQIRKAAIQVKNLKLRRYEDGRLLTTRPTEFSDPWFVIHRADYHEILMTEATRLGVEIQLNSGMKDVDFNNGVVYLEDGTSVAGDIIVGADGLWSTTREKMLGKTSEPFETGDLAYRGTFTLEQLRSLNDPRIEELCTDAAVTVWIGPDKHCVFYPVRSGTQFNLVLLRPDDLPAGARTIKGDIQEMRFTFQGWDDVLTKIISCVPSVLKWKLLHHDELSQWAKGRVILLGDACHPTLPYQAQGAAMAVEDGAILGKLLGKLSRLYPGGGDDGGPDLTTITHLLRLFETMRKTRTTQNVKGAVSNRAMYHLHDGPEQRARDAEMAGHSFTEEASQYRFLDMRYNEDLFMFPVLRRAEEAFDQWVAAGGSGITTATAAAAATTIRTS